MRLEKISSDCKNILGLSYWHVYTTFAMGREAIFKKSGKSMHPTVQCTMRPKRFVVFKSPLKKNQIE